MLVFCRDLSTKIRRTGLRSTVPANICNAETVLKKGSLCSPLTNPQNGLMLKKFIKINQKFYLIKKKKPVEVLGTQC